MVSDTVYDAQGRAVYTDDPHKPGEPTDGTHTIYDQSGQVIGTERLANVVITIQNPTTQPHQRADVSWCDRFRLAPHNTTPTAELCRPLHLPE